MGKGARGATEGLGALTRFDLFGEKFKVSAARQCWVTTGGSRATTVIEWAKTWTPAAPLPCRWARPASPAPLIEPADEGASRQPVPGCALDAPHIYKPVVSVTQVGMDFPLACPAAIMRLASACRNGNSGFSQGGLDPG